MSKISEAAKLMAMMSNHRLTEAQREARRKNMEKARKTRLDKLKKLRDAENKANRVLDNTRVLN